MLNVIASYKKIQIDHQLLPHMHHRKLLSFIILSNCCLRLFTANIFSVVGWACPLHQLGVLHVIQNITPNLPQGSTRLATSRASVLLLPAAAKALRGEQITGSSLPETFSKYFKNTWQTVSTLLSWSKCFSQSHCLQVFDGAPSEGLVNHFTPLRWLIIMLT